MLSIPDVDFVDALLLILIFSWLVIGACWMLVMQRALELVRPLNRMPPSNVWLTFIPLFGLYWQFVVVQHVADSLADEYRRRGIITREARPGFGVGLTANILLCCVFIPSFGTLVSLFSHISRLVHLFKIKKYTAELKTIIAVQSQYPLEPAENVYAQQEINPAIEEAFKQNNPNRFLPPETEEDARKRWGRK